METGTRESKRTNEQTHLRLSPQDAALLRSRAAGAGLSQSEYVVALMRSRKTPEHDARDVAVIAGATASIHGLQEELKRTRASLAEGFGLFKFSFISEPIKAGENKPSIDGACTVAKAVIRTSEKVLLTVETASIGPLLELEGAIDAIRLGRA